MCPFSRERGKKVGRPEAPKRPRFPGCPLRGFLTSIIKDDIHAIGHVALAFHHCALALHEVEVEVVVKHTPICCRFAFSFMKSWSE